LQFSCLQKQFLVHHRVLPRLLPRREYFGKNTHLRKTHLGPSSDIINANGRERVALHAQPEVSS
jgi:hypothetical protein